ncbi:MAG: AAA family ATPase [Gemmatimonadota bacterium]
MMHGLIIGKFLPYHAGHAHLIRAARARVDRLTVLVCSIAAEPIPGGVRHRWMHGEHPDCTVLHVSEELPQTPEEHPSFWARWLDVIARHAGHVDVVFTSEMYGDELAARLGARHDCVDLARHTVPISGSAIREDPMATWDFLPRAARPWFARRVVLLGPESSGKTTLARTLAEEFETVWVPEYGREYCEAGRPALDLTLPDFEAIAWGQAAMEDAAVFDANRLLICDTDLLTTCTWSDLILDARPAWLTQAARSRHYDLALLLDGDVPWVDDGTRVLDMRRAEHSRRLRAELRAAHQPYVRLGGTFAERTATAIERVRSLLTAHAEKAALVAPLR